MKNKEITNQFGKTKEWFTDRIGKKVFRDNNVCICLSCSNVGENGVLITDNVHAEYLFDISNELNLDYFDENLL